MEKDETFVAIKSEIISLKVVDMMGDPGDMEIGEIKVSLGVDNSVRVFNGFSTEETLLVAIHAWSVKDSSGGSVEDSEKWLQNQPEEEPENGEELSRFPLRISEDLVIDQQGKGYIFEDGSGNKMSYEEVVKVTQSIGEFYKKSE